MDHKVKLSVLFMKESNVWVGQCMEFDIAAQGATLDKAKTALSHTIAGQIFLDVRDGKSPLAGIKAAPEFYKAKFQTAEKMRYTIEVGSTPNDVQVEDARLVVV